MIAKLTGTLDSTGSNWAIIDVNGVGYMVFCSGRTLAQLPEKGGIVRLLIDTHVREDHIHLYGFGSVQEQEWFRLLTSVQGVGNKVGLALLSAASADQLATAIAAQDKSLLTAADGVGPKLASRILSELQDKIYPMLSNMRQNDNGAAPVTIPNTPDAPAQSPVNAVLGDAISALVNLGYRRGDAFQAVQTAAQKLGTEPMPPLSDLIRSGLAELSS